MATPIVQVSHLPSAASFYVSLVQPLGLFYLSATSSTPATLHFGRIVSTDDQDIKEILFSIVQAGHTISPTSICFVAPSPKSVSDFYNKSRSLNPGERDHYIEPIEDGGERAATRDFDGNLLQALYSPRGASRVGTMERASTDKEARRVLEWQEDVARSVSGGGSKVSSATETIPRHHSGSYPRSRLVSRQTVTTEHYHNDAMPRGSGGMIGPTDEQQSGGGMSGKAIMGTLLGAAAGVAVAYAMVRSESSEYRAGPPLGARRASLASGFTQIAPPAPLQRVESFPGRTYISGRSGDEGAMSRYVKDVIATPHPGLPRRSTYEGPGVLQRVGDRSQVSSHRERRSDHGSARERSRSEDRSPYRIMRAPRDRSPSTHVSYKRHQSHRSSHHSSGSGSGEGKISVSKSRPHISSRTAEEASHTSTSRSSHHSSRREGSSYHSPSSSSSSHRSVAKAESYTSARSRRSESTVKPSRSSAGGSTTTIRIVGGGDRMDRGEGEGGGGGGGGGSYVSAREVPLPRSLVSNGGLSARDVALPRSMVSGVGYAASVAPSDSVSSVGMKRERERLKERMGGGERWR